jgi:2-polyprenyl-3-methyl-5-hydroxy-6-metoxy-1,4-benzoquinol methylase
MLSTASEPAPTGDRFAFGVNWTNFNKLVDDARVREAELSLSERLGDLRGHSFLDAGCGSGLFSLAAARLGAQRIRSFAFDPDSVQAALTLRDRFEPSRQSWAIERGDVLDHGYIDALGQWDIVYSWGVLHHTGNMRQAWEHVARLVAPGGRLFISIYNDQGVRSKLWRVVKRNYHRMPAKARPAYIACVMGPRELLSAAARGPAAYIRVWRDYGRNRGMSRWHDLVDWVGGMPFEVARPDEVFEFFRLRGFTLEWMLTAGTGLGCNQFVFSRPSVTQAAGRDSSSR